MRQGFVYVLVSPNSNYIKIGGTEKPISERLRGINGTVAYSDHGPWELSDFLHVTDWRLVEGEMHRHFQKHNVGDVVGTRELFSAPPHEARQKLRLTDVALRVDHEKTDDLFANRSVILFLFRLFQLSGLFGNLDIADLRQRNAKSVFARYHSYDAVSQLLEYKRATQNVFGG
jgi:T5orf172 domain-containing protein